jgi:hypothetical protein
LLTPDQSLSLIRMNSDQDNVPTSRPSSWRLQGVDQDDLGESRPSSWNSARSDFPPPTPEITSRANSLSLDSSAAKKQAEALSKILEDTLSSRLDEFKSSEQPPTQIITLTEEDKRCARERTGEKKSFC